MHDTPTQAFQAYREADKAYHELLASKRPSPYSVVVAEARMQAAQRTYWESLVCSDARHLL